MGHQVLKWLKGITRVSLAGVLAMSVQGCDDTAEPPPDLPAPVTAEPADEAVLSSPEELTEQPAFARTGEPMIVATGRSPIPQPNETFDAPIPAVRLVPEIAEEDLPAADEVIPWNEAPNYMGHEVTVEGKIVDTANIGSLCFLNFVEGDREQFYLVIYDEAFPDVPGGAEPEDYYLNKLVRVSGEVTTYNSRPQIRIYEISQIEVVNETGQ